MDEYINRMIQAQDAANRPPLSSKQVMYTDGQRETPRTQQVRAYDLSPAQAMQTVLLMNGKDQESARPSITDLTQKMTSDGSDGWLAIKSLPFHMVERMATAKLIQDFASSPDVYQSLKEAFPDIDLRFLTTEQKQCILNAFLLDWFGEDFVKKVWNGVKELGGKATSKLWKMLNKSDDFKSAKRALDDIVSGLKKGDFQRMTKGFTEGYELVKPLIDAKKKGGRVAGAPYQLVGLNPRIDVKGDEEQDVPLIDTYQNELVRDDRDQVNTAAAAVLTSNADAMRPFYEATSGPPVKYSPPSLISTRSRYNYDAVSLTAIAAWICPEDFPARMPVDMTQRTALAGSTWSQTYTTNATGSLGIYVFPWAVCQSAANTNGGAVPFITLLQGDFDPKNGVSTNKVGVAGPLNPVVTNIQSFRVNSSSLRLTCIPSYTSSQGQVQIAYFTDFPNSTFPGGTYVIPQNDMTSMTNYQLINLKTTDVRSLQILDGPTDLNMIETNGSTIAAMTALASEGWYILISGAPPTTPIVTLTFSYVVEFMPTSSSLPMLNMLYADPGPATVSLISNLIKAEPGILRLQLTDARTLASSVATMTDTKHDTVLNKILDHLEGVKLPPINAAPFVWQGGPPELVEELSFRSRT